MTIAGLGMVMDGLILVLLGATVFYAARLSLQLKVFRESRGEMVKLIKELSSGIDKAERAIEGLRLSAREAGRDLQGLINDASALSDELQIMTQAGDSMASRLENLAEKNSRIAATAKKQKNDYAGRRDDDKGSLSGFAIHDHEFDSSEAWEQDEDIPSFLKDRDEDDYQDEKTGQSKAEQELYEAMRARRHKASAGSV